MGARILGRLTNLFALWVVLGTAWAWWLPAHFDWFAPYITPALGLIMLSMGITLHLEDFREVLETPRALALGVVAQFLIMPLLALLTAHAFALPVISILATPVLVKVLVGEVLPVDAWAMFQSMIVIVLLPLFAGVFLNQFNPPFVRHLQPFAPLVSMALTTKRTDEPWRSRSACKTAASASRSPANTSWQRR